MLTFSQIVIFLLSIYFVKYGRASINLEKAKKNETEKAQERHRKLAKDLSNAKSHSKKKSAVTDIICRSLGQFLSNFVWRFTDLNGSELMGYTPAGSGAKLLSSKIHSAFKLFIEMVSNFRSNISCQLDTKFLR